jgi:hypothetical protein
VEKVEKFEALLILIFLLPGFVGVLFHTAISETEKEEALDKIILALALTLVSHVVYAALTGGQTAIGGLISPSQREKALQNFLSTLGWTTVIAILLGIFWGAIQNKALLYRAAVLFRLTHRTGAIDVWHQTFARTGPSWVRVRFKDGVMLQGWAQFYSEHADPMQLFLAEASWLFPKAAAAPESVKAQHSHDPGSRLRAVFARISARSDVVGGTPIRESDDPTGGSYDIILVEGPGVLLVNFDDVLAIERLS